jgi:hypothetical protein
VVDPRTITDTLGCRDLARCGGPDRGGSPAVTLEDLASFSPTAPQIRMEPDGWMLRGLPANFIAAAGANTHDGSLLGQPVSVRFTPTAYRWTWGDGSSDAFTTPGSTWEDLGLPRFSETDTSHTYTTRGTLTVSLAVDYTVDYRVDGGTWTSVAGTVAGDASVDAYVGTATTVIVPDDCTADPAGTGC